jgi:hypothetical protein
VQDSEPRNLIRARLCELSAIFATVTVVALVQVVLSTSTTFSRWKGGGFGMYSEPHPLGSRCLWVELRDPNGSTSLRLSPIDSGLDSALSGLSKDRRAVWMRRVGDQSWNLVWPHDEALRKVGEAVNALIRHDSSALGAVSGIDWPKSSIATVSVVETRLDLDRDTFDNKVIATVRLNQEDDIK